MTCVHCGGYVEWKGSFSNLTHTKCDQCGAFNSQIPEGPEDSDLSGEDDACLVAAASEMLVMLIAAQERECSSWCSLAVNEHTKHCRAVSAVITKARGAV